MVGAERVGEAHHASELGMGVLQEAAVHHGGGSSAAAAAGGGGGGAARGSCWRAPGRFNFINIKLPIISSGWGNLGPIRNVNRP